MKFQLAFVFCVSCSVTLILSTNVPSNSPVPLSYKNVENADIEAFVQSLDKKPNLLLTQTISADKKSFFGLILIPCK